MIITSLLSIATISLPAIEYFGRSGGGGSSSGGSGGALLIAIGYVPMHFVGAFLRKRLTISAASVTGWIIAIIYAIFWMSFSTIGFLVGIAALVGIGAGLYNWFDKIAKLSKKAKEKQELALQKDGAWDIALLNKQATDTFQQYQTDWSGNNSEAMKAYMTPRYFYHNQLMILALQQLKRRNEVGQPLINSLDLVDINDDEDNTKDSFTMLISAKAVDDLLDETTNSLIFRDTKPFKEFWKFIRTENSHWLLDGIAQTTEDLNMRNNVIADFAKANNYCYSPDWGWLLLPNRGQLFNGGKFGTSDINNHVIGVYNDTLIQLYNYIPNPSTSSTAKDNYIIAQVALPKTYGNIVVRKKRALSIMGIKGLTRISMEWGDFNKRYEVWASDMERVTSFELLNPSFMVKLQELPFELNIEVVDNIVYLYSNKTEATAQTYESLLQILYQAFKEMRM